MRNQACWRRFSHKAAAERGLYRALKELRQVEKAAKVEMPALPTESIEAMMGSILQNGRELDDWLARAEKSLDLPPFEPGNRPQAPYFPPIGGGVDVPFAIGKRQ